MLRSLYSGVTGLRTHQIKMDVIGNNIANVNTNAFKSSRVTFKDIYYQSMSEASANTEVLGGSNPRQIGYGTTVSSIDVINTRGGIQITDRTLDLYISGDGYFVMKDNAGYAMYTRAGNFTFDVQGALVDASGRYVAGWQPCYDGSGVDTAPLIIPNINDYTNISIGKDGIIYGVYSGPAPAHLPNSYENVGSLSDISVAGYTNIRYENGQLVGDSIATGDTAVGLYNNIRINADGTVTGDDIVSGASSVVIGRLCDFAPEPADYSNWEIAADGTVIGLYKGHFTGQWETLGSINGPSLSIPGYSDVVFADGSLVGTDDVTGNTVTIYTNVEIGPGGLLTGDNAVTGQNEQIASVGIGNLVSNVSLYSEYAIEPDGTVTGLYTLSQVPAHIPGEIEVLGQIALAKFTNPEGLSQHDGIYFEQTMNSGAPLFACPGSNATGTIVSGGLEMSNVDLSKEFTDMITTQRGFQANSRIITVSDEMLQELVNLKR